MSYPIAKKGGRIGAFRVSRKRPLSEAPLPDWSDTLFQGSHEQLLTRLVDDNELGAEELSRLAERVRELNTRKGGRR